MSFDRKKTVLIAAIAAVVLAIVVIIIILAGGGRGQGEKETVGGTLKVEVSETESETAPEVRDEVDPENADLGLGEGESANAKDAPVSQGRSHGIDVSKWQGKIDWSAVKADGVDFAFIRIGYRGENGIIYKDENADYNIQSASKAGVLVGVYFFSTAVSEAEAAEEAEWTLSQIDGYSISYPVVYDCEGYKNSSSRMYNVAAEDRTNCALAFMNTVSAAGYDAMVYGSRNDFATPEYWNISKLEGYKVWVAQYSDTTYPAKDKPDYSGRCDAWQYTNKGSVGGALGNVDLVVAYFTCTEAAPKNPSKTNPEAKVPQTDEEKMYSAVSETVTAKEVTNLRRSPTTKSDIVATIRNGETVERIGIGTNGWSKLKYNGEVVYAITSYLTTDLTPVTNAPESEKVPDGDVVAGNTFTPQNDKVTAKEKVNLRRLPTTDSEVVGTLTKGEFLTRVAVSDKGWSRLDYNGQTVYAVTSYLTLEVPVDVPANDGFEDVDEQVTAKVETNLRSAPSTDSSEVVYTLKNGEYVHRIGVNPNGWSKLVWNGQTVYAKTSYLTTAVNDSDGFAPVDEQVTAKIETNLRSAPTTDGSEVVYTLKNGEFVQRTGIRSDGWSRLVWNGQTVYAMTSYLATEEE